MNPTILAIIVTFNGIDWIENCLNSIKKSTVSLDVLVIDNKSTDNTVERIRLLFPEIRILVNKENIGFGQANNIGLKIAVDSLADYVLLLNQDVYIEQNTVQDLITFHKSNPDCGILSPVHLSKNLQLDPNFSKCVLDCNWNNTDYGKESSKTNFVNAACWLISRKCFSHVGGFDPLFFHYGEDRDFCNRVKYHKYEIIIVHKAKIIHDRKLPDKYNYHRTEIGIYTSGIAHLKNINNPYIYNIITWTFQRSKKVIKFAFIADMRSIKMEFRTMFKLIKLTLAIHRNRISSKKSTKELYLVQ